jgi:competence protein ComEA
MLSLGRIVLFCVLILPVTAAPNPLDNFEGCTLVLTDWADGDSFRVKTAAGQEHTVRLYGVDCIELHVDGNDRNLDRLREQRRYFGITDAGKNNEESMKIALSLAKEAADFTAKSLQKPFTLHTRFADGGGDPNFKRILGFVTLADGKDLGSVLVQQGLARAKGIISTMPDGTSVVEARGMLQDLEIQALKKDRGIWARTDWDKLPVERRLQRKETAEAKIVKDQNAPGLEAKINPNTASLDELMMIPGIAEITADAIIKGRPYANMADLLKVRGIGPKTLEKFAPFFDLPHDGR